MMNQQYSDLFTNAVSEAQKATVWDKLSVEQQAQLVSRYIMRSFATLNREDSGNMAGAVGFYSEPA